MNRQQKREMERQLADIVKDPVKFARHILRHNIWEKPREILHSIATNSRTSVRSCHASAKTFTAAEAVTWWTTRFHDGKTVTTAPSWTQVELLLWGEIHKAVEHCMIDLPDPTKTKLEIDKENYAIGLSTNQGTRFQGWHGRVLVVGDEAVGIRQDILDAIEGMRAGGDVRVLLLGNPTVPSGFFYDTHTKYRRTWKTIHIDGLDTPNTRPFGRNPEERLFNIIRMGDAGDERLKVPVFDYLIKAEYVYEKWYEWGRYNDPRWDSRVRGEFPTQSDSAVYSMALILACESNTRNTRTGKIRVGIDVAGPGEDETSMHIADGGHLLEHHSWRGRAEDAEAGAIAAIAPYEGSLEIINVDEAGVGYYFTKHLKERFPGKVQGVNVGNAVWGKNTFDLEQAEKRFYTQKAQWYWRTREMMEQGDISGLGADQFEETRAQLIAPMWRPDTKGRIVIESKDELRTRGVPSPDRAESFILTFVPWLGRNIIQLPPSTVRRG